MRALGRTQGPGAHARTIAVLLCLSPAGCAAIAGLGDPPPEEDDTSESESSATSPPPSTRSGEVEAPGADPASPSPSPSGDACRETGATCSSDLDCCGECSEARRCVDQCKNHFDGCDPSAVGPCCLGLFCSLASGWPTCQPCIESGKRPRTQTVGGGAKSCCSRTLDGSGNCG